MRKKMVVANWKMYKTLNETENFVRHFPVEIAGQRTVEMIICAPFTALARLTVLLKQTALQPGAQNMHFDAEGAFTGEISPVMLRDAGAEYVLIGHSERRRYFGEEETIIHKKMAAALKHNLIPILCVGENEGQRRAGETDKIIGEQLRGALGGLELDGEAGAKMVLAYEPVWAIGTGNPARGEDAAAVAGLIRSLLEEMGIGIAEKIRILYGGSVQPENITAFTSQEGVDGALVGGSSLEAKSFAALVEAVLKERGA